MAALRVERRFVSSVKVLLPLLLSIALSAVFFHVDCLFSIIPLSQGLVEPFRR